MKSLVDWYCGRCRYAGYCVEVEHSSGGGGVLGFECGGLRGMVGGGCLAGCAWSVVLGAWCLECGAWSAVLGV